MLAELIMMFSYVFLTSTPIIEITCHLRSRCDHWYDADCRAANLRLLERRRKLWKSDYARNCWILSLNELHQLVKD